MNFLMKPLVLFYVQEAFFTGEYMNSSLFSFLRDNSANGLFVLFLLSILYFYSIYKVGDTPKENVKTLRIHQNRPFWIPLMKSILLFLTLLPLCYLPLPKLVMGVICLVAYALLMVLRIKEINASLKKSFLIQIFFYSAFFLISPVLPLRGLSEILFYVGLNLWGIFLVRVLAIRIPDSYPFGYLAIYYRYMLYGLHAVALIYLIRQDMPASFVFGLSAGIGLLQAVVLQSVKEMLLNDATDQFKQAVEGHWFRRLVPHGVLKNLNFLLRVLSFFLLILVLLNNLGIFQRVFAIADHLANSQHKLGGWTFTYAHLIGAFVVIWLANWIQKNLLNLFSGTPKKDGTASARTLFPIIRLLIVTIGFLFALHILGVGLDKLTIVIGALSVGVGLGLQNIINNFVSGIILVFEKPFKIGDYIELADKRGKVLAIGIRASTLLTDQGAKVVLPNGDLLSGRVVNWTFSEADIRVNFELTIDNNTALEKVKNILNRHFEKSPYVDMHIPIRINMRALSVDNYTLTVQVGIQELDAIDSFRNSFFTELKSQMHEHGIAIVAS